MKSLPNYLQTQRKRLALSQEEVGFLLGITGMNKGNKVCRDAEAIYGRPVRELFAGLYQQAEQDVAAHAKVLNFRKLRKTDARKQQAIIQLADPARVNLSNQ